MRRGPAPGGPGGGEPRWDAAREAVEGEYIVRFREYRMAAEHRAALEAALGSAGGAGAGSSAGAWQWVERANQAAAFPTDFGLLRISFADVEAVKVGPAWQGLPMAVLGLRSCYLAALRMLRSRRAHASCALPCGYQSTRANNPVSGK